MSDREDPVLRHARREALVIGAAWLLSTVYCCAYCYLYGYIRPGKPLGAGDVRPILGMPGWFFGGVFLPWCLCVLFTLWFVGFYMVDDDLGVDHAAELDAEIREGAGDE